MQPESLIRTLRQLFSFASSVCLLVDCPDFLQSYKIRVMRTRARTAHGLTENLATWEELRQATQFTGLLVGNGASRAVWDGFDYKRLPGQRVIV